MPQRFGNLSATDRALRILLGVALVALGLSGRAPELAEKSALLLGWYPLATGLIGWSPIRVLVRAGAGR